MSHAEWKQFLKRQPDVESVDAFIIDINGVPRGKKLPRDTAEKIFKDGLRLPRSAFAVDIWGQDVLPAGLVAQGGDSDGICVAVPGTLRPVPWAARPTAQVLLTMQETNGAPFFADPREVLRSVVARYHAAGLKPVVAVELEFYLLDAERDENGCPQPPLSPRTGKRSMAPQMYSLNEVEEFGQVMSGVAQACAAQGIPADTTLSENGPGQFEINLHHVPDALRAADDAVLMRRVIKCVARKYDLDTTFMAKPYGNRSGNGMHVHFSVLDAKGKNIFEGKDAKGSDALRHAIAGCLDAMPASTALFAPNLNSYRRFQANSHAPTRVSWGYDNRTAALRVPQSDLSATRIEHRVPGADANPYLVLAGILAAALDGMTRKLDAPAPATSSVYESDAVRLPSAWPVAVEVFEHSPFIKEYLGDAYRHVYVECKRQEMQELQSRVSNVEYDAYLRDL
jgi:glutamine synthetase